ncbi:hypothetical protein Trydic_g125 [Trypoxylus dichotomus]
MESWRLNESTRKKLEAFEMWLYRRILKKSWVDIVPDQTIQERVRKEKEVIYTIKKKKLEYLALQHHIRTLKIHPSTKDVSKVKVWKEKVITAQELTDMVFRNNHRTV